ncbi:MAG: peptide chain release factor N(5)-glutamine methyltransferase [Gammaproteobacteria bacterium]|nr:peptide chain release factor N(5)-glutamine methyltransferase [Gammaproteobacteria bacterium]
MQSAGSHSVEALVRAGLGLLEAHSDSPRLDTELLLAHALGWPRAALYTRRADRLAPEAVERCFALLRERQSGRPVAQITGRRDFWTLTLAVTPDVLVPRPETELAVERALARLPDTPGARLVDLGTGSGAIALAVASERPAARVLATDRSAAALAVARANAVHAGLGQVDFAEGDWFEAAPGSWDVVVSNPPYVGEAELPQLARDLGHEPRVALTPGPDALAALRQIATAARGHLAAGGWLVLEHGATQGGEVNALLRSLGYESVATSLDLARLPRVTEGRWPGAFRGE